jgi:hypothetical protein
LAEREKEDSSNTPNNSEGEFEDITKRTQADAALISIDDCEQTEDFLEMANVLRYKPVDGAGDDATINLLETCESPAEGKKA